MKWGVALVVGVSPTTAIADSPRLEASGFVGVDYFGDDIELGNSWAPEQVPGTSILLGARLGWIALPAVIGPRDGAPRLDVGVEVEGRIAPAFTGGIDGGRDSYFSPVIGYRGHVLARVAVTPTVAPHLVIGGGGESVASTSPFMADDTDAVFYWGAGASWNVTRRWAIRIDARHGLTAGRMDPVTSTFELQLGAGGRWELSSPVEPARPPPDADDDGIADDVDRCPAEAETFNKFEDDDGCPDQPDQDDDGLLDDVDRCPFDAENVNQIDDADGCPDADDDRDGILGSRDACADQAEDRDGFKDDDGCPDPDNDGDGIPDTHDTCPTEPEVWNGITDEDGCPDELPAKVKAFEGTLKGINFQIGKSRILPGSRKVLDRAVAVLNEFPGLRVAIEGHTDDRGGRDKNVDLSRRRADAVKWYMVDAGIAVDRIDTIGVGPDRPRAPNTTASGRTRNRRIELHVIVGKPKLPSPPPAP